MKKIKGLLYCTKAKPYLVERLPFNEKKFYQCRKKNDYYSLNGKIVAECDFDVEEIVCDGYAYLPLNSNPAELETKGCLNEQELENYFTKKYGLVGYAIHIKNLHIFDEPRELSEYYYYDDVRLTRAPQNMMYAYDNEGNKYVVISIQSQWMCLILNRIKDVEVRKKVLKEMLKNE